MTKRTVSEPYFWAKYDKNTGQTLSVQQHSLDVAAMMNVLFERWISYGAKQSLCFNLGITETQLRKLCLFVALSHDIGKISYAFQAHVPELNEELLTDYGFTSHVSVVDIRSKANHHSLYSALLIREELLNHISDNEHRTTKQLRAANQNCTRIAEMVCGHHGWYSTLSPKPVACVYDKEDSFWHEQRANLLHSLCSTVDMDVTDIATICSTAKIKTADGVAITGLLIMADWIGSNTAYFGYLEQELDPVLAYPAAQSRAEVAWQALECGALWAPGEVNNNTFATRFGYDPRAMQTATMEHISQLPNGSPSFTIIEAVTGEGKTEAALAAAEILAHKYNKRGVTVALPTCATSNAIFDRVIPWLDTLDIADTDIRTDEKLSVMLTHSRADQHESFAALKHASLAPIYDGDSHDARAQVSSWFTRSKTNSLADFAIGTIDQVLMAALSVKHVQLKHIGLLQKVLIIDEIHAADAYMQSYLCRVLQWCGYLSVPVVACSATLSKEVRLKLLNSYREGASYASGTKNEKLVDIAHNYPLISTVVGDETVQNVLPSEARAKNINYEFNVGDNLSADIVAAFKAGACVGVICNTVKDAQQLYREVRELAGTAARVVLLHSKFTGVDRARKEQEIVQALGKNSCDSVREPMIVIGTQVLEQSLDIDFDILFTEIAPIDVLIQRIGRLHRHDRVRTVGYSDPRVVIFGVSEFTDYAVPEFGNGTEYIYGEYLLINTVLALYHHGQVMSVPDDVLTLMDAVYEHKRAAILVPETWYEHWNKSYEKYCRDIAAQARRSETFLLAAPKDIKTRDIPKIVNMSESSNLGGAYVRDMTGEPMQQLVVAELRDCGCVQAYGSDMVLYNCSQHSSGTVELNDTRLAGHMVNVLKEIECTYEGVILIGDECEYNCEIGLTR